MTITQTVDIPADRRIFLDLPQDLPLGRASVELKVVPFVKPKPRLKCLEGADTSLVDSLVGVISNPENKTYDELRMEGMQEKYGEYFK
jgi:hypothetical protein